MSTEKASEHAPVLDWFADFDFLDPAYVDEPYPVWDMLRRECPVAHTERHGGSWMVSRYGDAQDVFHEADVFSTHGGNGNGFLLLPHPPSRDGISAPPLSSDPPDHTWQRRLLLPLLSRQSMLRHEAEIREVARRFAGQLADAGGGDAAVDYAQQIPGRVIVRILGVEESMVDEFVEWVHGILREGFTDFQLRSVARRNALEFFAREIASRRSEPRDDLLTDVALFEHDGALLDDQTVLGMCLLLLTGGVDTTWSVLGSSLLHLATHREDRERLVADPALIPIAVEEFLRAFAPVSSARIAKAECTMHGRTIAAGDRVIINTPAANRDPEQFDCADEVVIDRARNRHTAFGSGIHRCAGSHLARLELVVSLEEWLARIPNFEIDDSLPVTWSGGQVRGPNTVPVRIVADGAQVASRSIGGSE